MINSKLLEKLLPLLITLVEIILKQLKKQDGDELDAKIERINEIAEMRKLTEEERTDLIDFV